MQAIHSETNATRQLYREQETCLDASQEETLEKRIHELTKQNTSLNKSSQEINGDSKREPIQKKVSFTSTFQLPPEVNKALIALQKLKQSLEIAEDQSKEVFTVLKSHGDEMRHQIFDGSRTTRDLLAKENRLRGKIQSLHKQEEAMKTEIVAMTSKKRKFEEDRVIFDKEKVEFNKEKSSQQEQLERTLHLLEKQKERKRKLQDREEKVSVREKEAETTAKRQRVTDEELKEKETALSQKENQLFELEQKLNAFSQGLQQKEEELKLEAARQREIEREFEFVKEEFEKEKNAHSCKEKELMDIQIDLSKLVEKITTVKVKSYTG